MFVRRIGQAQEAYPRDNEPVPRLKKQEISTLVLKEKESLSVPAYVSYLHINFIEEQTEMK